MTASICDQCQGRLYPCDIASNLTTCVECARRALRASRTNTRAVVVFSEQPSPVASVAPVVEHRPLGKITPEEWATFTVALRQVVRDGEVHQGDMRRLIRGRIRSQIIPSCYSRAIGDRLIREVRRERSNDVAGRNTNKLEPVYEYAPHANGAAA